MNRKFQKALSLLLTLAMLCGLLFTTAFAAEPDVGVPDDSSETVVTTVEEGTDETASEDEYAETITGGGVISASGTYTISDTTPGVITIKTTDWVTLIGGSEEAFLNGISFTNAWTDESGDHQTETAKVLINGLFIASPYQGGAVFDFAEGTDIKFQYTERNVLETQGYNNGAVIRVAKTSASGGSKLTLTGTGTESYLYLYKHCGSAAIGGNMNEACGKITIEKGNLFVKGSQTGAVIGGDSKTVTNGDITIEGGINCIVAVARGAAIGASNQGECAGNVTINGGSTLINVDFSGSAIGRGDSGTTTGTLYMNGGSLKCVIDANARTCWGFEQGDEDIISNNAITAQIVYGNSGARTADVAEVDLSGLELGGELTITATVAGADDMEFTLSKGLNRYDYVRSTTVTSANWAVNTANQSAYIYLPTDSTSGTILAEDASQNSQQYTYTYDGSKFVVSPAGTVNVTFAGNAQFYVNGQPVTSSSVKVKPGSDLEFRVKPVSGDIISSVTSSVGTETLEDLTGGYYRLCAITDNTTITAVTTTGTSHNVTFSGNNQTTYIGKTPVTDALVNSGGDVTFYPVADEGYVITSVKDGTTELTPTTGGIYTLKNVTADKQVVITAAAVTECTVTFSPDSFSKAVVNGEIVTNATVQAGGTLTFVAQPHVGYAITGVTADKGTVNRVSGNEYTVTTTANTTVSISTGFAADSWLSAAETTWYDGSASTFTLTTAAQLAGLAKLVNSGTSLSGKTVKLGADIDLTGKTWAPIGGGWLMSDGAPTSNTPAFQGAFDGQGHTISGLTTKPGAFADGFGGFGLFGVVKGGTISNVTVSGEIKFTNNVIAVGGIVGYTTGSISNVVNKVAVTVDNSNASMTGGVAGVIENTENSNSDGISITNSANLASVKGRARLGGIVGAVYATVGNPVSVDQCFNTGALTGVDSSGRAYVGGIVGYSKGAVTNCYNTGSITVGEGRYYVGGIAGILNGASEPYGSITDCYADGSLTCTGTSGLEQMYAIWGANDDSSNVAVTNAVYLSSQTQETMSASCTNLKTLESLATSAAIGADYLSGTYFAQYGTEGPVLQWQTIPVNGTSASALNTALAQVTEVKNIVVIDNQIALGRGDSVTIDVGETGRVVRGSIAGNLIAVSGGASLTLNSGSISGNANNVSDGGSLAYLNGGTLTLNGGRMINNEAEYGGAVYVYSGTFNMTGGTITGNAAEKAGGAVRVASGTFNMTGGTITGNHSALNGGGVSIVGSFTLNGGSITKNSAQNCGGGLDLDGGSVTLVSGSISNNSANYGPGVYFSDTDTLTIAQNGSLTLGDTIFLDNGDVADSNPVIHVSGTLACDVKVEFGYPEPGLVVAQKTSGTFSSEELNKFSYSSGWYYFALSENNTKIIIAYS